MSKAQEKFNKVMSEWEKGKLRDSHGTLIKYPKEHQRALAVAFSESRSIDKNFKMNEPSAPKKEDGGTTDDYTKHMGMVEAIFENPKYNYSITVSGDTTEEDARKYFVGQYFNVGVYPKEQMEKIIDIKFHPKGTYEMKDGGITNGDIFLKDEGDFYYVYQNTNIGKDWLTSHGYSSGQAISPEEAEKIKSVTDIDIQEFKNGGPIEVTANTFKEAKKIIAKEHNLSENEIRSAGHSSKLKNYLSSDSNRIFSFYTKDGNRFIGSWGEGSKKLHVFKDGGSVDSENTANVLVISSKHPLYTQIQEEEGSGNTETLESTPSFNVLKHTGSGKIYVAFPLTYIAQVDKHVIDDDLRYIKDKYKLSGFHWTRKPVYKDGGSMETGNEINVGDWITPKSGNEDADALFIHFPYSLKKGEKYQVIREEEGKPYMIWIKSPNATDEVLFNKKHFIKIGGSMETGGKTSNIPDRYKQMGFTHVGHQKKSTRPEKKWMVLAKKGDQYKVVHGGQKGMKDFSQHHSEARRRRFWNRMGGEDSEHAKDPFSPLYWHKKYGTWEDGGEMDGVNNKFLVEDIDGHKFINISIYKPSEGDTVVDEKGNERVVKRLIKQFSSGGLMINEDVDDLLFEIYYEKNGKHQRERVLAKDYPTAIKIAEEKGENAHVKYLPKPNKKSNGGSMEAGVKTENDFYKDDTVMYKDQPYQYYVTERDGEIGIVTYDGPGMRTHEGMFLVPNWSEVKKYEDGKFMESGGRIKKSDKEELKKNFQKWLDIKPKKEADEYEINEYMQNALSSKWEYPKEEIKQYLIEEFLGKDYLESYLEDSEGKMKHGGQLKMLKEKSYYQSLPVYKGFKWVGFWDGYHHFQAKEEKGYTETRATDEDIENGNLKDMIDIGVTKSNGGTTQSHDYKKDMQVSVTQDIHGVDDAKPVAEKYMYLLKNKEAVIVNTGSFGYRFIKNGKNLVYDKKLSRNQYFEDGGSTTENRNYEITLIENSPSKRKWKGIVSKKEYNHLSEIKNQGGFLRYDIDLYDDKSKEPINKKGLSEFMDSVGVKYSDGGTTDLSELTKEQKFIKSKGATEDQIKELREYQERARLSQEGTPGKSFNENQVRVLIEKAKGTYPFSNLEKKSETKNNMDSKNWMEIFYIEGADTGSVSNISTSIEAAQKALASHNKHLVSKQGLGSINRAKVLKKDWDADKITASNLKKYLRELASTGPLYEDGGTFDPEKKRLEDRIKALELAISSETTPEGKERFQKAMQKVQAQLKEYKPVKVQEYAEEREVSVPTGGSGGTKVILDIDNQSDLNKADQITISVKAEGVKETSTKSERSERAESKPEIKRVEIKTPRTEKATASAGDSFYIDIPDKYYGPMRNVLYQEKKDGNIVSYRVKTFDNKNRVFLESQSDVNVIFKAYNEKREKKGDKPADKDDVTGVAPKMKHGGRTKFTPVKKRVERKSVKKNLSHKKHSVKFGL